MRPPFLLVALGLVTACGSSSEAPNAPAPVAPGPVVAELGAPEARALVVIGTKADGLDSPRDLAFDADVPDRLWVVNAGLSGVVIYDHAGAAEQTASRRGDIFAPHFMSNPTTIAIGAKSTFATCSESRNEWNGAAQPIDDFMGPTLWSSSLDVFAAVNQEKGLGREGSHLDMLHESPWCMGIEHDTNNVYYAFDGLNGHLVRYDFRRDHGPGGTEHDDGSVRRFIDAKVTRVPRVPSHLAMDHETGILYVADTGGGRIMALDTATGTTTKLPLHREPLAEYASIAGATYTQVVAGLHEPSGLALHEGKLFVGEHATGDIVAFDLTGKELGRVSTGAKGLMGIAFSADGKLHFVDADAARITRLDPVKSVDATDHADGPAPPRLGATCEALENDGPDVTELHIPRVRPDATTGGVILDGKYHVTKIESYTGVGGPVGKGTYQRRETYVVKGGRIKGVQRTLGDMPDHADYHVEYDTLISGTSFKVAQTCFEGPASVRGATYDVTATGIVFYYDYTDLVVTWTRVP
jgi:outer membrane protein assembly factor BamB